ncbi:hypothetical protein BSKO_10064 [Bryopsis sp. KO-2023]|nr:hypothetical protein BSKO_10064 [Bryopsis sp. KO-2023]
MLLQYRNPSAQNSKRDRGMLRTHLNRLQSSLFPHGLKSAVRARRLAATSGNPSIPADLRTRFETDGFAVIEGFATPDEVAALRKRAGELIDEVQPEDLTIFSTKNQTANDYFNKSAGNISLFFEENAFNAEGNLRQDKSLSINKLGHAMHDLDPTFRNFSRSPKMKAVFDALACQQRPTPVQSMYIFKQPRIGGEVVPHQDSTFLYTEPPSVIGMWLALEKATVQNGCLYILPKSHQRGLDRRFGKQSDGEVGFDEPTKEYDIDEFVPVEVGEGALVMLHGAVVHCSKENTSAKSRHAYTVHFIDGRNPWSKDNWLQRSEDFPFEAL